MTVLQDKDQTQNTKPPRISGATINQQQQNHRLRKEGRMFLQRLNSLLT